MTPMRMLLLSTCLFAGLAQAANDPPGSEVDAQALSRHVQVLASDAFEGRAPATPGEQRTVDYLIAQFQAAGVQPGGEDGGWVQTVPLVRAQVTGKASLTLHQGDSARALAVGTEITAQTLQPVDAVSLSQVPLVFVGYGIDAPERGWDDYKGQDLRGKIAVMLINDPDFQSAGPGVFDGRAVTYYGRWTYKYEEAARRGAAGVLIVHETEPAAYPWATVQASGTSPLFDIQRGHEESMAAHTPLRGWISRALAGEMFAAAGLDFEAEKRRAMTPDFAPVPLGDARLSAELQVQRETVLSRNVVAKLSGQSHPDEAVVVSAHWDSYGIGQPDAQGRRIRAGAVDNATGVAAVLEIARVMAAGPRPARSVYFAAFTAEEKGLLGAVHFAAHPPVAPEKLAAVLNIEMFSPDGANADISSWGRGRVDLEQSLAEVAAARGRHYTPDPALESGFFYRADHFAFARLGVPAITIGAGLDALDGGVSVGQARRQAYFANCYHQPCDAWSPQWKADGLAADTQLVLDLARRISSSRTWPQWEEGAEFNARRRSSDAARQP